MPSLTVLLLLIFPMAVESQKSPSAMREAFANPPAESRILKIIHSWPDVADQQDALIRKLLSQGFGGVVCNVSFEDYLESEEKWQAFTRAVTEAREAGMALWLYDERGYPSGVAGGHVLREHPELEAQGLLVAEATTDGERVDLDLPPGEIFLAAAFPRTEDGIRLEGKLDLQTNIQDGRLSWQPPSDSWHVMAITKHRLYEGTHAQLSLADKLPYINLLLPEATARFIEVTHEQYAQRLGEDLGEWFVATFTDEPSLMSLFLRPMPYRVLPWSPNLPETFQSRQGYALEPLIPALLVSVGGREMQVRYDFWRTVGQGVAESFFGQIETWCEAHGLPSGGHLLAEESVASHVPLYGDFFQCARRLSAPSIDCLTSVPQQVPWFVAKLISSAAELEGHTIRMCETSDHSQVYRPEGDTRPKQIVTEAQIRGTCNRLFLGGMTTITSYYSFSGLSDEQLNRLNLWVGRCSALLQGGYLVSDIAVLYPAETLAAHHVPSHHWGSDSAAVAQVENVFKDVSDGLYSAGRDLLYVDSRALLDAEVEEGALVHGNLRWRALVLPYVDTLPDAAWEKIVLFWRKGGIVIALGAQPLNSEHEFPSAHVRELGREMFGNATGARMETNASAGIGVYLPHGSTALLPEVLDSLLKRDVQVPDDSPLRATHRRIEKHEVYFIVNDSPESWQGEVSLAAKGAGELWRLEEGDVSPSSAEAPISLSLDGYGAAILRFPESDRPQRLDVPSGFLSVLSLTPLPKVNPDISKGEFVEAEFAEEKAGAQTVWQATGTLTKGDVDTYLFVTFRYSDGLDLSDTTTLVFDTWVPEGQGNSGQLLVILRDVDGADYLANTGRPLSASGHTRIYLPLSRFQLAGWSNDANAQLDLARIAAVSIGWGGYYGDEGERVRFSLGQPQSASRRKRK